MKKTFVALTASIALVALAGCGSDEEPAPTPTPTSASSDSAAEEQTEQAKKDQAALAEQVGRTIPITIADGKVDPQGARRDFKVGDEVRLQVTSDAVDELHVHSDPEHTFDVAAGDADKVFTFTVENPGQIAVELHDLGVTVVQLVVTP